MSLPFPCLGRIAIVATLASTSLIPPMASAATGAATAPSARTVAHQVVAAAAARLDVMPSVAYTKFRRDLPVNDPVREAAAEKAFVSSARQRGVPASLARRVILEQFSAAKQVQRRLIRQWHDGSRRIPTRTPADLATQLRPRIDAATSRLLDALVTYVRLRPLDRWRCRVAHAAGDQPLRKAVVPRNLRTALAWALPRGSARTQA